MPQWNDWRLTTWISTRLISQPSAKPTSEADGADRQALAGEHGADLPPRHADVAQHAEFAPPRKHQRAERRRKSEQADDHRGSSSA